MKLPKERVAELVAAEEGNPFGPGGKIFKEWIAIPKQDRKRWGALLREGIKFVAKD